MIKTITAGMLITIGAALASAPLAAAEPKNCGVWCCQQSISYQAWYNCMARCYRSDGGY